ncbi:hypothetical protein EDB87DRAFT_720808 [Lactarius vividus]|nr:hypothetical protein EDB87DRAFT_720808 [Lactarius vividus]
MTRLSPPCPVVLGVPVVSLPYHPPLLSWPEHPMLFPRKLCLSPPFIASFVRPSITSIGHHGCLSSCLNHSVSLHHSRFSHHHLLADSSHPLEFARMSRPPLDSEEDMFCRSFVPVYPLSLSPRRFLSLRYLTSPPSYSRPFPLVSVHRSLPHIVHRTYARALYLSPAIPLTFFSLSLDIRLGFRTHRIRM